MPIRPENLRRYPGGSPNSREWKALRASIIERAGNRCETCGIPNKAVRGDARIILTIAHLDHTPENNDPTNLRALCQRCHNRYDAAYRAAGRKARKKAAGRLLDGVLHDAVPEVAK